MIPRSLSNSLKGNVTSISEVAKKAKQDRDMNYAISLEDIELYDAIYNITSSKNSSIKYTKEEIPRCAHIRVAKDGTIVVALVDEDREKNVSLYFNVDSDKASKLYSEFLSDDKLVRELRSEYQANDKNKMPLDDMNLQRQLRSRAITSSMTNIYWGEPGRGKNSSEDLLRSFNLYPDKREPNKQNSLSQAR